MSKICKENQCGKKTSIGGQALIEGIMMRGPKVTAMAVRNPQGEIVLEKWETQAVSKSKLARLPLIRGVFGFINSMVFGYKCLMRSAEIAGLEEVDSKPKNKEQTVTDESADVVTETADAASDGEEKPDAVCEEKDASEKPEKKEKKEESSALMTGIMIVATVLGVALAVGLFVLLPTYIYKWCASVMPFLSSSNTALNSLIKSVFEGVLRIAVLVAYMSLVSLMKDIRRTFQYHGAEHKTIFCYEHNQELTVENVRKEGRFHPRCGTSFLILMLLVGIFISFFIDPLFIALTGDVPSTLIRGLLKLVLVPLTMGIGYELIKFAGRHDNLFTRIISAPGRWLQRITVREPTDDMIECAIAAFKEVIPEDESDRY